jgi:LysR family cyn operon transcriptional activator
MELRHLRYFVALGERLSFTRAAEQVHVTQSTLSHQIRQLEDELGLRLFDRVGKRVLMTEAGELLFPSITKALRDIDTAVRALRGDSEKIVGTLRIGAVHSININLMPNCVATFLARNPSVRLVVEELAAPAVEKRLRSREVDLGIAYEPADTADLSFEPLYEEELALAVTAAHPLASRKRVRMIELHRRPVILLTQEFATRRMLDRWFESSGAEPKVIVEMNTIGAMLELVRRSDAAAIVPERAMTGAADIRRVALEGPTPRRTPGLIWLRKHEPSAAARSFASIVRGAVLKSSAIPEQRRPARRPRSS